MITQQIGDGQNGTFLESVLQAQLSIVSQLHFDHQILDGGNHSARSSLPSK